MSKLQGFGKALITAILVTLHCDARFVEDDEVDVVRLRVPDEEKAINGQPHST